MNRLARVIGTIWLFAGMVAGGWLIYSEGILKQAVIVGISPYAEIILLALASIPGWILYWMALSDGSESE